MHFFFLNTRIVLLLLIGIFSLFFFKEETIYSIIFSEYLKYCSFSISFSTGGERDWCLALSQNKAWEAVGGSYLEVATREKNKGICFICLTWTTKSTIPVGEHLMNMELDFLAIAIGLYSITINITEVYKGLTQPKFWPIFVLKVWDVLFEHRLF